MADAYGLSGEESQPIKVKLGCKDHWMNYSSFCMERCRMPTGKRLWNVM